MQYLLLIYGDERATAAFTREQMTEIVDAHMAYGQALRDAKVWVGSNRLRPIAEAKSVRIADGQTKTLDGPFAETKEQLGGFWIIDSPDLDGALSWAAKGSAACGAPVEVRPFQEVPEG